ncbi:UNVERIFIED_CONTAM: hypothetical protein FKN15_057710 [Acipenser sinensis]
MRKQAHREDTLIEKTHACKFRDATPGRKRIEPAPPREPPGPRYIVCCTTASGGLCSNLSSRSLLSS